MSTKPGPKYLTAEAQAIHDAKQAYREALARLQADCPHGSILKYQGHDYVYFYVCEDCGLNEKAAWDSPVHATGNALVGRRAYDVAWSEYAAALPKVDLKTGAH